MRYGKVVISKFIVRPNRFIAFCELGGNKVKCHVKNTGRGKEILLPGTKVILSVADNPERSTKYDLIAAYKGDRLINIDSQAPNAVVRENFHRLIECDSFVPEFTFGESRFDFCAERNGKRIFVEVKGVTQEEGGHVLFPDAPTERGRKHVHELTRLAHEGYECHLVFIVQMSGVDYLMPNYDIDPEFGAACETAAQAGVVLAAYDCKVSEDQLVLGKKIEIKLGRPGFSGTTVH